MFNMPIYQCPKCGNKFKYGTVKFCPKCGYNLDKTFIVDPVCPICQKHYPTGTIFCSNDGAKLTRVENLKHVCEICGTEYEDSIKYCPKDGGRVLSKLQILSSTKCVAHKKASLGNRLIAYILDGFVTLALAIPSVIFYFIGISAMKTSYYEENTEIGASFILIATLLYALPVVYSLIKDGLSNGQSIGKRATNLKVVDISTYKCCSRTNSCIRNLVTGIVCIIPFGFLIDLIMVIVTNDGRKPGDKAANTIVINVNNI